MTKKIAAYVTTENKDTIKAYAAARGITEADAIREALEMKLPEWRAEVTRATESDERRDDS